MFVFDIYLIKDKLSEKIILNFYTIETITFTDF